jgi:outer membrane biosynthesis protein TonB
MTTATMDSQRDATVGWLGAVLLHGLVAAIVLAGWARWKPDAPPQSGLTLEATLVVTQPRRAPPPAPAPTDQAKPAPSASNAPVKPVTPVPPKPATPRVLTTPVPKAEKPLPAVKPAPADERVAREKAAREARAATEVREREAALKASLAAEERATALRGSAQAASWYDALRAHIERQWRRPVTAKTGIRCVVLVDQVPGGEVVNARISECNGDDAVRQSIEAAVFRASPLPPPPDPALFERRLELVFEPKD